MKFSISNIAWRSERDDDIYASMREFGYMGLEIAPTRIFPETPYSCSEKARSWAASLREKEGLVIPSMQSIWYGRRERIFGTQEEREELIQYTRRAIRFAEAIACPHLVFGCPRNRNLLPGETADAAIDFFRRICDDAAEHGCTIGMEANPPIYNTNYINTTAEALALIQEVNHPAFKLNLDVGTMVQNGESVSALKGQVRYLSHVHISEPYLACIKSRDIHHLLATLLREEEYQGWISIEMGTQESPEPVTAAMKYVKETLS